MRLAIIKNGKVVETGFYKDLFPDYPFPPTGADADFMASHSCLEVTIWKPTTATQKLIQVEPYIEGNMVYTVLPVEKTPEELAEDEAKRIAELKASVQLALKNFAAERDFDGIGEAAALLNSTNQTWASEAATLVRLWDESWQAVENGTPLPILSWE